MIINEKLKNMKNLITLNDAKDIINITAILAKFNNSLNNATNDIKRKFNARFINEKNFKQIDKNMTYIMNLFDKLNDTILINKKNIQNAEKNIYIIKNQIKNEAYERSLIEIKMTNIINLFAKFNDTLLINQKNIKNSEEIISIIKVQI